jgi:hypothetical protein
MVNESSWEQVGYLLKRRRLELGLTLRRLLSGSFR